MTKREVGEAIQAAMTECGLTFAATRQSGGLDVLIGVRFGDLWDCEGT
jgi:hypothetical protein